MDLKTYFAGLFSRLGLTEAMGSWSDDRLESDGLSLYLCVLPGNVGAPAVVFIPGTSVYALCYLELLLGLRRAGFNVVGFDPRGQGQSGGRRGDYTVMEHVADARAVVAYARDRFGGPVFVMGSSQGGIEAFYLAAAGEPIAGAICHNIADLTDPESVRLVRFGPRGYGPAGRAAVALINATASLTRLLARLLPGLKVPIPLYLDLTREPMRVFGNAWEFVRQDPLALQSITMRAFASLAGTSLPRPVEEIATPILVLHSAGDHIFPETYIRRIYDRLRCDRELKLYPDLPHLITIEHVPRILPDVIEWIHRRGARLADGPAP